MPGSSNSNGEGRRSEELSEVDLQIISALSPNARKSNVQIAKELGVAEGTIRRRIQRMMESGILRVVPVLNPRLLGFVVEVRFDVSVELGALEKVGQLFTAMPEVYGVVYCTGARDLSVGALFRSDEELLEFLNHRLPTIPGIQRVTTTHVLKTTKRLRDWWPIVASIGALPIQHAATNGISANTASGRSRSSRASKSIRSSGGRRSAKTARSARTGDSRTD